MLVRGGKLKKWKLYETINLKEREVMKMIKLMTTDMLTGKAGKNDKTHNLIDLVTCPKRYEVSL
ncbi:hypothetical protein AB685_14080 [Bacillus sp. LL01]|nr:hypothetical protein AB685_14080 [Bacillus sp. LL01]